MSGLFRKSMVALTGVVIVISVAARQPSAQSPPSSTTFSVAQSEYVGAAACKDCHRAHFNAWDETKHSKALSKLTASNRSGGKCIKCHVTGEPEVVAAQGDKPSFPNVQCESCHGPGLRHVEAAKTGDSVTDRPKPTQEETCTKCHNTTSPRYKPFFYRALVGLVHLVRK
jgi:hypothetical protein